MKTLDELLAREKEILAALKKNQDERSKLVKEQQEISEQRYALQKDEAAKSVHASNAANAKISAMLRADRTQRIKALFGDGALNNLPKAKPEGEESGIPSAAWKVADLKEYAQNKGIDLGEAKKKDEILAVISVAEAAAEPEGAE